MIETITAIALLCGPRHQPGNDNIGDHARDRATACQNYLLQCVHDKKILNPAAALEMCLLEGK